MAIRCLIVDDNQSFLDAARKLLQQQGLTVVGVASTSEEALRRNQELLRLSNQILELTKAIRSQTNREAAGAQTATRWPGGGAGVVHPYVLRARPAKPRYPADRCRWLPRRDRGPRGQLGCIPAWPRRVAATTLDRRA